MFIEKVTAIVKIPERRSAPPEYTALIEPNDRVVINQENNMDEKTGKIYRVNDDFNYNGSLTELFEHTVARVQNAFIDDDNDYFIKFYIPDRGYLDRSYNINLLRNDYGNHYQDVTGDLKISCEKFSNDKKYFLYGKWIEEVDDYT